MFCVFAVRPSAGSPFNARGHPPNWSRKWGYVGFAFLLLLLSVHSSFAVILWSDPGTMLIFDNGVGRDMLEGAVKRDDSANDTLYFKFHVDPQSDSTTEEYFAALELFEAGAERLGIGNALKAWAYSAFFEQNKQPESGPAPDYVDLRSSALDQSAAGTSPSYELPRRGVERTIVFKVQFVGLPVERQSSGGTNVTMSEKAIRILVADDHYVVRMGITALVNTEPNMEVVGEAADGNQAVEMFQRFNPNLVLMDLRMPAKDGIAATKEIRNTNPNARVLMLTTYDGDTEIHRAIEAGAQGYVLKNSTGDKLIPALRAVAGGEKWIPKEIASRLAARKMFEELTPRELQVLQQMAKGLANKEIAEVLKITEHTVKDHLKSILGKLRVADRTEAVTVALQRGIIQLQ